MIDSSPESTASALRSNKLDGKMTGMTKSVMLTFAIAFAVFFIAAGYLIPSWRVDASRTAPTESRPPPVSVTNVGAHIGQTVTVEGEVSRVYAARSGVTFIDMGGAYPNNLFAGVIFSEDAATVGDVSRLTGKTVELTGTINRYRGKPEIILKSAEQIEVH